VTHPRLIKEADLHKTIADWGRLHPATAGRLRGSGLKAGFPDILIIFNGRATGIELKAPGGALSKVQRHMILRLRGAGMMTYVCHSAEEVISALRAASLPVRNMEVAA
jgi:hypothetical protein